MRLTWTYIRRRRLQCRAACAGEDSLSHHVDYDVGVSVIDRFTYHMLDFFQEMGPESTATVQDLINYVRYVQTVVYILQCEHPGHEPFLAHTEMTHDMCTAVIGRNRCVQPSTTRQICLGGRFQKC